MMPNPDNIDEIKRAVELHDQLAKTKKIQSVDDCIKGLRYNKDLSRISISDKLDIIQAELERLQKENADLFEMVESIKASSYNEGYADAQREYEE